MSNSRRLRRSIHRHQHRSHTPLWLDLHDAPAALVVESAATLDRPEEQTMPYAKRRGHSACNADQVAVVKTDDGQLMGCHDSERAANRQLAALNANEPQSGGEAVTELGVVEAPRPGRPGRMQIQLIRAGWSLNGRYYPAEVLRRDGPSAFPAGTQAFVDHATEEEDAERPAGSVRNLAAVMTTGARWDKDRNALVAEVRLFQPWREQLTDMAEHIGMSIRAWVMAERGERDGRTGDIVSEIVEGRSVDFVTVPAAGGQIVSVLESAQPQPAEEARNVGAWLESRLHLAWTQLGDEMYGDGRLTRDERVALSSAIGDALQAWTARVEADAPQLFERDLFDEPPAPAEEPAEEGQWPPGGDPPPSKPLDQPKPTSTEAEPPDLPPASDEPAAEAPTAATGEPLPVAEMATDLTRFDRLLGHTTPDLPAPVAGSGQTAEGDPPPAPIPEQEEAPMSGTQDGARAPNQAGEATEAQPATTQPVAASEAQVAVVAQERDQYRARAYSLAEALTEAQNTQRRAEAERDAAVTEMRRYRANETGRITVDRLLTAAESGVPEQLQTHIAPRVHAAVQDRVPLTEAGEVDTAALESLVASAIRTERVHAAQLLEAQGVGTVNGLGAEGDPTMQMTREQFDTQVSALFAELPGMDESTVALATKGRA